MRALSHKQQNDRRSTDTVFAVLFIASVLVVDFAISIGSAVVSGDGYLTMSLGEAGLRMTIIAPLVALALYGIVFAITSARQRKWSFSARVLPKWEKLSILGFAVLLILCWTPWLIAVWPGAMNWDTYYEIWMCYPENHPVSSDWDTSHTYLPNSLSDHHPLFDTILYGLFARISHILFGTWNYGVFALVLIQFLCYAVVFSACIAWMKRVGVPDAVRLVLSAFIAFIPVIPGFASTLLKDSTFSLAFLIFFLCLCELSLSKKTKSTGFLAAFAISALLCCLTKKVGLYVAIISVASLLIVKWRDTRVRTTSIATMIAMVATMLVVLPAIVFPALDVAPGGKQEMLSLPFQQTAKYVKEYDNEVTEEQRAVIDSLLDYSTLASRFDPLTTDPVKNPCKPDASSEEISDYLKIWIEQGMTHPKVYFSAWLGVTARFWAPGGSLSILMYTGDVEHYGSPLLWQPDYLQNFNEAMGNYYDRLSTVPIVSLLFESWTYTVIIPLLLLLVSKRCRTTRKLTPVLLCIGMNICACLICPIYDTRYCLPLVVIAPICIALLFSKHEIGETR